MAEGTTRRKRGMAQLAGDLDRVKREISRCQSVRALYQDPSKIVVGKAWQLSRLDRSCGAMMIGSVRHGPKGTQQRLAAPESGPLQQIGALVSRRPGAKAVAEFV